VYKQLVFGPPEPKPQASRQPEFKQLERKQLVSTQLDLPKPPQVLLLFKPLVSRQPVSRLLVPSQLAKHKVPPVSPLLLDKLELLVKCLRAPQVRPLQTLASREQVTLFLVSQTLNEINAFLQLAVLMESFLTIVVSVVVLTAHAALLLHH
jgi:hypothetical protein